VTSHVDELTAIVRHRYETGAYGSAHFRITSALWEAVRTLLPKPAPPPMPWERPSLDPLLAIPIVLDDDMDGDAWRLVDIYSDEILFRGGSTGE
jgi:transposase